MFDKEAKIEFKVPAHIAYLVDLRNILEKAGREHGFSKQVVEPLKLATEEAVSNIINHGYGKKKGFIHMKVMVDKSELTVALIDRGNFFDPRLLPSLDVSKYVEERKKGGLGVALMRRLLDRVDYRKTKWGNELRLTKYKSGPEKSAPGGGLLMATVSLVMGLVCCISPLSLDGFVDLQAQVTPAPSQDSELQQRANQFYNQGITLYKQGHYQQALPYFERALSRYRTIPHKEQIVRSLRMIGEINRLLGRFSTAITNFEQALQETSNRATQADIYLATAWAYHDSSAYLQATLYFEMARQTYQDLVNPHKEAECYIGLGYAHLNGGNPRSAIDAFQHAADLFQRLNNKKGESECLYYVGKCYYELDDQENAVAVLKRYTQAGTDSVKLANSHFWLGNIHFDSQRYPDAIASFQKAEQYFSALNDPLFVAHCNYNIGQSHFNRKSWQQATLYLQKAADNYGRVTDYEGLTNALRYIGHANYNLDRYPAALATFKELARAASLYNLPAEEAKAHQDIGHTYVMIEQFSQAAEAFRRASRLFLSLGDIEEAIDCLLKKGDAHLDSDQPALAGQDFREALQLSSGAAEFKTQLAESRYKLAEILCKTGELTQALSEYEAALSIYRELNADAAALASCLHGMGLCNLDLGGNSEAAVQFDNAIKYYTASGDSVNLAHAYYNAGLGHLYSENLFAALKRFEEALSLYDTLGQLSEQAECHLKLGQLATKMENFDKAISHYDAALNLYRAAVNRSGMAESYLALAGVNSKLKPPNYADASRYYEQAREHYGRLNDPVGLAECDFGIAQMKFDQEQYPEALSLYQKAAEIFALHDKQSDAALCFQNAGGAAFNLNNYTQALSYYQRAEQYYRDSDQRDKVVRMQLNLADCYLTLFQLDEAWRNYEKALNYYEQVQDYAGLFNCLMGIGNVYYNRGRYSEAKSKYQEALRRSERYVDLAAKLRAYDNIAAAATALGDFDAAMDHLNRMLNLHIQQNQVAGQLEILLRKASLLFQQDRYEQALEFYDQVLSTVESSSDPNVQRELQEFKRVALINKANTFHEIGESDKAMQGYKQALHLSRAANDSQRIAASLTGIGNIQVETKNYAQALTNFQEVLALSKVLDDSVGMARTYINLGNVYNGWQQFGLAQQHYELSNNMSRRLDYVEGKAIANNNLGIIELARGSNSLALRYFQSAEQEAERAFSKRLLITIYSNQGVTYEQMGRLDSAQVFYERAIAEVERIRGEFKKADLINSYIESTSDLYDRMITLLFEQGKQDLAYLYIERSRSAGLIELYKQRVTEAGDTEQMDKLAQLERKIKEYHENIRCLQKELSKPKEARNDKRVNELSELIATTAQQVTEFERFLLHKYQDYPGMVEVRAAQIAAIQDRIPTDAVVVTYYPAKTKLYIYVASRFTYQAIAVNIDRETLYKKIRQYRETIDEQLKSANENLQSYSHPEDFLRVDSWFSDRYKPLTDLTLDLYGHLIQPVEKKLNQAQTLIFIPSGLLYYLPLHALARKSNNGDLDFVIERWTVAYLTSTTFAKNISGGYRISRDACLKKVVAFGYPGNNTKTILKNVRNEMKVLKGFVQDATIFLDKEASEKRAKELCLQSCVLVISGHAIADPDNTNETHIQLASGAGEDGLLTTWEIERIRHDYRGASTLNFVILPACETAYGEQTPRFGVRNLVHSFSQIGAASVMATLWKIEDYFSSVLMQKFYHNFFVKRLDKAKSLQRAQIELLSNPRTRHPYLWAGFLLYGYWYEDVQIADR